MQVDATEEPALGSAYSVQGYPTLKWFVNGEVKEYSGGRIACVLPPPHVAWPQQQNHTVNFWLHRGRWADTADRKTRCFDTRAVDGTDFNKPPCVVR